MALFASAAGRVASKVVPRLHRVEGDIGYVMGTMQRSYLRDLRLGAPSVSVGAGPLAGADNALQGLDTLLKSKRLLPVGSGTRSIVETARDSLSDAVKTLRRDPSWNGVNAQIDLRAAQSIVQRLDDASVALSKVTGTPLRDRSVEAVVRSTFDSAKGSIGYVRNAVSRRSNYGVGAGPFAGAENALRHIDYLLVPQHQATGILEPGAVREARNSMSQAVRLMRERYHSLHRADSVQIVDLLDETLAGLNRAS